MARTFTLAEAIALLPQLQRDVAALLPIRADLAELIATVQDQGRTGGTIPELKALEARLHEGLEGLAAHGVEVKGYAPILLDFPSQTATGVPILLCWLEGEPDLGWYHRPEHGFMGRRPLSELPQRP